MSTGGSSRRVPKGSLVQVDKEQGSARSVRARDRVRVRVRDSDNLGQARLELGKIKRVRASIRWVG